VSDSQKIKDFYEDAYRGDRYAAAETAAAHGLHAELAAFLGRYDLRSGRCLEVGCGRGAFQDLVDDYTGVDLSAEAGRFLHKPFLQSSATALPFPDDSFDVVWTVNVLEHIPQPEVALAELRRVVKPGGYVFLAAAWHCRDWAAEGYPVRRYADLDWRGRCVKFSLLFRESPPWLLVKYTVQRFLSLVVRRPRHGRPVPLRYRKIRGNFDVFWMSDSDAVVSVDQLDAHHWFVSRGDAGLTMDSVMKRLFYHRGPLVFRIGKPGGAGGPA
jgi:SAM-dependent methyltransferase